MCNDVHHEILAKLKFSIDRCIFLIASFQGDFDLFGGTDEDLFSQALMQLQDTNVKVRCLFDCSSFILSVMTTMFSVKAETKNPMLLLLKLPVPDGAPFDSGHGFIST